MSVNNLPKKPEPGSEHHEELAEGDGPPYDGSMEARVKRLEDDVAAIKTDLAIVRSNYATKADLSDLANSLIKWMIATTAGSIATTVSVMAVLLNNASPKVPPPAAPIVITVPYPAPADGPLPGARPRGAQKQEGSPQAPLN